MRHFSRRRVLLGGAAIAGAGAAAAVWNLHQTLPPQDPSAQERYRNAQDHLLSENGSRIRPSFVHLARPSMRAQVLEGGQGEPVLFIHGGAGTAAQWEPLLSRMSESVHVYAPDRPGCGLSEMFDYKGVPIRQHAVDFVGSAMDALGLNTAAVIGNSMGGYFGLVFALAHPERVSRLITVGEPAGSSAVIPASQRLLATRGINGILYSTAMRPGDKATYEGFRRILVAHPERIPKTYLDCCTAASEIPGATESWLTLLEDVVHGAPSTLTYHLRPELARLMMPTLMIWGEKDTFGPPSLAQQMTAMMPNARSVIVADAGHLVWLDQPDAVLGSIRSFLQT